MKYTKEQALKEGYEYCGHKYQETLDALDDIDDVYLADRIKKGEYYLWSKETKMLSVPNTYDVFENIIENSDLCEADWDTLPKELNDEFGKELQVVLDKIGGRKSATHDRTEHTLTL